MVIYKNESFKKLAYKKLIDFLILLFKAKKPSIPERFYSPITRQSSALRETIKKLESFQNSKEYEGWKKDVELFEHHIGNMIVIYFTQYLIRKKNI